MEAVNKNHRTTRWLPITEGRDKYLMVETQSGLLSSVDGFIKCILNDSGPEVAGQGDQSIQAGAPQRRDGSLSP